MENKNIIPCQLTTKPFYSVQKILTLWLITRLFSKKNFFRKEIIPKLTFKCDGLILTKISDPLEAKQDPQNPSILKWKPGIFFFFLIFNCFLF